MIYATAKYGCILLWLPPPPLLSILKAAQFVMDPDLVQAAAAWALIEQFVALDAVPVLVEVYAVAEGLPPLGLLEDVLGLLYLKLG